MDQTALMRVVQTPRKLDRDVEHARQRLLRASLVEPSIPNPLLQRAAAGILRKDPRNSAQPSHIVAADDVWMQPEVNPRFAFPFKVLGAAYPAKGLRLRAFHRQIHIPSPMPHPVNPAHSAFA